MTSPATSSALSSRISDPVTPEQFLRQIAAHDLPPVILFLGPEAYHRRACREALLARALPEAERESGLTRHDLDEVSLRDVLDDAWSFSLFAPRRVIWAIGAEGALPKRLTAEDDPGAAAIAGYLKNPTPGVTLVFEASRYGFEGDDKPRTERVRKFYSSIPTVVEFHPFSLEAARALARDLAHKRGLTLGTRELGALVEALGCDAARIDAEIEKLSLFAGTGRPVTLADLEALTPDARTATLFSLVNALGRSDRLASLQCLDTLVKEGEYLPLALSFLGAQFRLALAAHESGARNAHEIQSQFTRLGIRIWRDRAEQVAQTLAAFPPARLQRALQLVFEADKSLRDARPDDRVVLEEFVLNLTRAA